MKCAFCSFEFCMACLKPKENGKWMCKGAFEPCPNGVAPRQKYDASKNKFLVLL